MIVINSLNHQFWDKLGILQLLDREASEGFEAHVGKLKNQFQNNIIIELCPSLIYLSTYHSIGHNDM